MITIQIISGTGSIALYISASLPTVAMEPGGRKRVEVIPALDLIYEANETKGWKGRQHNWGLLQAFGVQSRKRLIKVLDFSKTYRRGLPSEVD